VNEDEEEVVRLLIREVPELAAGKIEVRAITRETG
jgi:transcription antitermination factor NusA-like protein